MNDDASTRWRCDRCGEPVAAAEGWLEWTDDEEGRDLAGFQIVHHRRDCMYDERMLYRQQKRLAPGNHLEFFLGDDGLAYMLRFAMTHELRDYREYLDLIQRVHVPYYESARPYLDEARRDGHTAVGDYLPEGLKTITRKYGKKDRA